MKNIIEIDHITKDYGNGRGVFDISFQVKKGEVLGFLGPNGAGKTTTIRQLMGFLRPDSGSVQILGMDCFHDAHKIAGSLGYLPGEIAKNHILYFDWCYQRKCEQNLTRQHPHMTFHLINGNIPIT